MSTTETTTSFDGAERRRSRLYSQIQHAVFELPWAVLPGTLRVIVEAVTLRLEGAERFTDEELQARIGSGPSSKSSRQLQGGIAVIPLYGVLMPKATLMSQISGGTSLEEFQSVFKAALASNQIGAIILDIDSPGGSTSLVPETAALIRSANKPVIAVSNALCCSGAYWLAAQADEIVASPSSLTGSIGVYTAHDDLSGMEEKLGVKTTLVSAGKYKVEGNEHEPLSPEAEAAMQALVDEFYGMFVADVAKGRGVAAAAVRDGFGQGRVLSAAQAKSAGMVDTVGTLDETIARVARGASPAKTRAESGSAELSAADARAAEGLDEPAVAADDLEASDEDATEELADQVGETHGPETPARAGTNPGAAVRLLSQPGFRR